MKKIILIWEKIKLILPFTLIFVSLYVHQHNTQNELIVYNDSPYFFLILEKRDF